MVDMAHIAGLVAADQHMNPVPFADFVTSTTHKTLRGPRGGFILCKQGLDPEDQLGRLSRHPRGPAHARHRRQGGGFRRSAAARIQELRHPGDRQRQDAGRRAATARLPLVSGGTDNHLLLVDVAVRGVTGKLAEEALDQAGITVNKNKIPFDPRPPLDPSGIRIGTPALTTRGMSEGGDAADRGLDRRSAGGAAG